MDRRQNWRKVLDLEVQRWSALPCDRLLSELSEIKAYEIEYEAKTYRVEVEILEEPQPTSMSRSGSMTAVYRHRSYRSRAASSAGSLGNRP